MNDVEIFTARLRELVAAAPALTDEQRVTIADLVDPLLPETCGVCMRWRRSDDDLDGRCVDCHASCFGPRTQARIYATHPPALTSP